MIRLLLLVALLTGCHGLVETGPCAVVIADALRVHGPAQQIKWDGPYVVTYTWRRLEMTFESATRCTVTTTQF